MLWPIVEGWDIFMHFIMFEKMNNIAIYDNGGATVDRITVVFLDTKRKYLGKFMVYDCLGTSETGFEFFQHSTCTRGRHLGKRVEFKDLHPELQERLINYFKN